MTQPKVQTDLPELAPNRTELPVAMPSGASDFQKYEANLRRMLRGIIIQERKRAHSLYRRLVKQGANPRQAA